MATVKEDLTNKTVSLNLTQDEFLHLYNCLTFAVQESGKYPIPEREVNEMTNLLDDLSRTASYIIGQLPRPTTK